MLSDKVLDNLKSVEIRHFDGTQPRVREFVKFLLSHGKKLEKMLIIPLQE